MIVDSTLSTQPCGCDPAAAHPCESYPRCSYGRYAVSHDALLGAIEVVERPTSAQLKAAHPEDRKLWRKQRPLHSGVLNYFPDALMEVAHVSWLGNEQHNPGEPLHWARGKSNDHLDAAARHLTDHPRGAQDDDGGYHLAKTAWRALAELQLYLERTGQ